MKTFIDVDFKLVFCHEPDKEIDDVWSEQGKN